MILKKKIFSLERSASTPKNACISKSKVLRC